MTESSDETWSLEQGVQIFLGDQDTVEAQETQCLAAPPSTSPTHSTTKSVTLSTQQKQRLELEALRAELQRLKDQLVEIEICPMREMSFWERLAKVEHAELLKATSDNEDLRRTVTSHAMFIDEMETLLRKKRRLMPIEEWETFILPMDPLGRSRAIHQILDRQFKKMPHIHLTRDLVSKNPSSSVHRAELKPQPSGEVLFEVIERVTLAAPSHAVCAAAWQVFLGNLASPDNPFEQSYEQIDAHTVYIHASDRRHAIPCHAHILAKTYTTPTSNVIVSRSILDDPMWTSHAAGDLVEDVASWVEVVPRSDDDDDEDSCVLTVVWSINLGRLAPPESEAIHDITALLASASIARPPATPGSLSTHSIVHDLASPAAPRVVTLGNLHIYLALSILLEEPFKRAISNVIAHHHRQTRETREP
ncbi:Aste57867_1856 [Aphanomyces stellatus]|uniref:Aste57867_1856 protein n=1 Tax=Aphanomyces stellatus TaxID=120398 RepID=A0A485KBT3_9STRA|nr:hypothetical protein As57867_001854 [Aphanomyces stellatus]VFT79063.1 Aste57867_1856 [Aphanomyces stellatus]